MKKIKNNEQAQQFFEVRDRLNAIADLARDIFSDGDGPECNDAAKRILSIANGRVIKINERLKQHGATVEDKRAKLVELRERVKTLEGEVGDE